jgi:hypothetical protein
MVQGRIGTGEIGMVDAKTARIAMGGRIPAVAMQTVSLAAKKPQEKSRKSPRSATGLSATPSTQARRSAR